MHQNTTPTKTIRCRGVDLTPYDMIVSLRQTVRGRPNAHEVDIGLDGLTVEADGDDTLITLTLTQEQTGGFVPGEVEYQINYGADTARMATSVGSLTMGRNLLTGEVEFASGTEPDTDEGEVAVTIGTMPPKRSLTVDYLDVGLAYTVTDGDLTISLV